MSAVITYNIDRVDEKFREILRNNDPRSFFSVNEPDSVRQVPSSLFILDENRPTPEIYREIINKGFRLLSSTIHAFELTNSGRFVYSDVLQALLDIKKHTENVNHLQIIEISMLCITLKVITSIENTEENTELARNITKQIFDEYVEFIGNFPA
tara:strand:+ start:7840 stop:8301 length:462 start_codon:yes stop_codon:yes gene_type:complete